MSTDRTSAAVYRCGSLTYTRVGLAFLFLWLLWGDFCYVIMEGIVPSILPLKLQQLGASHATMGLILTTMPMVITTALNPVISFRSDRFRSRWGRRIPFLLVTTPPLVASLLVLGWADRIGPWVHAALPALTSDYTANQVSIAIIALAMLSFAVFNSFAVSVFWYLFNDVVPEALLARFMSLFRMVGTLAVSFYNFFIFQHAESHALEIFTGAALLYLLGFGVMCWKVREGTYPPPPANIDGGHGLWSAIRTYGQECHRHGHYVVVFLVCFFLAAGFMATDPFLLFFYQATGLTIEQIGNIRGAAAITIAVMILVSGWLADRYHPVRIVLAGVLLNTVVVLPMQCLWLVATPSPAVSYYLWLIISIALSAPVGALLGVLDPPMFMRLFPRDRYGQFCSANALWRSVSAIVFGFIVGWGLDLLKDRIGETRAYLWIPVWQWLFSLGMLAVMWRVYRSWQRHGGDVGYQPP